MTSLNPYMTRGLLVASSLLAAAIATMILFAPGSFYAGYGIDIGDNVSLANELKAPTGILFAGSILMMAGALRERYLLRSLLVGSVLFSSFGLSRLASMAIDGIPSSGLVGAAALELALGALCLAGLHQQSGKNPVRQGAIAGR